ncbi:MAG: hypothetical protein QMD09_15515 [Desulfatibacillaceae bacterium]|nr:hypothetical protein [Desulfatibacillaceae bacterium]
MSALKRFSHLPIDWSLSPEEAVTLYLEWGNNNWRGEHKPVRSKSDCSYYFVVDSWGKKPKVVLIRRDSQDTDELASLDLPPEMLSDHNQEHGQSRGVFSPSPKIRSWLKKQMDYNN